MENTNQTSKERGVTLGRLKRFRQKRHVEISSLKAKSLLGLLVAEMRKKHGFSQYEAELLSIYCFTYLTHTLCDLSEGQIQFDMIEGTDNHKRVDVLPTKPITLTLMAFDDIELLEEYGFKEMQTNRILRMIEESYCGGGLLDTKRVCFLVNMTDRALRDRLKPLWNQGVRAPLAMMNRNYRDQMTAFRHSLCMEKYLQGSSLNTVRQDLSISKSNWERICTFFRHIYYSEKRIEDLAKELTLPVELVEEFKRIATDYDVSEFAQKQKKEAFAQGNVNNEESFYSGLQERFNFSPALADKLERDLQETAKEIANTRRNKKEIVYYAINDQEPAGKPLRQCELIPVTIEYYNNDDYDFFSKGSSSELKWHRAVRYTNQTRFQGALLNQIDLAYILGISPAVIQKMAKKHPDTVLATRGNLCDIGPGVSHAETILNLYLKGFTETQIVQRTNHDYASITRYIDAFTKVVGLLDQEGLNRLEIRKILGCSLRLVDKYMELYHKFNSPEYRWWMSMIRKRYDKKVKKKWNGGFIS